MEELSEEALREEFLNIVRTRHHRANSRSHLSLASCAVIRFSFVRQNGLPSARPAKKTSSDHTFANMCSSTYFDENSRLTRSLVGQTITTTLRPKCS